MRKEFRFLIIGAIILLIIIIVWIGLIACYCFCGTEIINFKDIIKFSATIIISLIVAFIPFFIGSFNYLIEDDRMFKGLFSEFNAKYGSEINDLLNEIRNKPERKLDNDHDVNLTIDYFNLCAEEYLWKKKNRIPKEVWEAWKAGIEENLEIPQVGDLFLEEIKTDRRKKSYYGLDKEVFVNKAIIEEWRNKYSVNRNV